MGADTETSKVSLLFFILIPFVCLTILIVIVCSVYICLKRREIIKRDPERMAVVGAENPDDITLQSLNNSLDYSYSDRDSERANGVVTPTDYTPEDSMLIARPRTQSTNLNFLAPPLLGSGGAVGHSSEENRDHNWRKFSNGSIQSL